MNNVLLVTNDIDRGKDLSAGLSHLGFSCTACIYADDVLEQDRRQSFSVVLIDISAISSQGDSTWRWFRKLKLRRVLPVIALISSTTLHIIVSEQGLDDFIMKPWNLEEMSTRIRRLVARANRPNEEIVIKAGDLVIDPIRCEVEMGGRLLALTFKEYELLKLLASNKGKVFTREALLNEIWGYDYYGGDRTVDVHIRRLRSKIEDPEHAFIDTVRNIGYKFKDSPAVK
ncbi:MAG: response regulator transcription factor [Dehalococcoidia bacterium]|nr:response regulator transcription factor [Dehalococcoidia bacterium]